MTAERSDEKIARHAPLQDDYGRFSLSARVLLGDVRIYTVILGGIAFLRWLGIDEWNPTGGIVLAGILTIQRRGSWAHASARHRIAMAVAMLLAFEGPVVVSHYVDGVWYPAALVQLAVSLVVVAAFIAVTRLPSFTPPLLDPDEDEETKPYRPARVWTFEERRATIGEAGELVFRQRWSAVFQTVILGILTAGAVVLIVVAFVRGTWFGGVVLLPASAALGYATWRAPRVALIVDADGLTVRNLMGTQRISWEYIRSIVPPDDDWNDRLRLKLTSNASISSGALTNSGFRSRTRRERVDQVMRLWGPPTAE